MGGMLEGWGCSVGGIKGEKLGNCNSIINKKYFKKPKIVLDVQATAIRQEEEI